MVILNLKKKKKKGVVDRWRAPNKLFKAYREDMGGI